MRIGTTPTHIFNVPMVLANPSEIQIVYKQDGVIQLTKHLDDVELLVVGTKTKVKLKLTQAETFKFSVYSPISIQMRILLSDGTVLGSNIIECDPEKCLDDKILVEEE